MEAKTFRSPGAILRSERNLESGPRKNVLAVKFEFCSELSETSRLVGCSER